MYFFSVMIRKDLACAKSFRTPAEALVVLTYYQKRAILSDNVRKPLTRSLGFEHIRYLVLKSMNPIVVAGILF